MRMSVVCFGELLIDFVASDSGVAVGDAHGFIKAPGGAPANVAVAVRRLGHPSAFVGQVGDDPFGHYLAGVLAAEGVDVRGITYSQTARTALAFVALGADGERTFSFYRNPSADMLMRPEDVNTQVIAQGAILHFGSISMIDEPSRSATLHALHAALAEDRLVSYDPNLRLMLWPDAASARAGMLSGLPYAHIVKISEEELQFLTDSDDPAPLWRDRTQAILVTRGAGGATVYTRDGHTDVGGYRVQPVDTTGAGDSFIAAVLAGILNRWADAGAGAQAHMHAAYLPHLPQIVRVANAVGALTTTQKGAIPALPNRAAVQAFIQHHDG
jgi:fructokinase